MKIYKMISKIQSNISFGQGNINFYEINNLQIKNYRQLDNHTISGGTFAIRKAEDLEKLRHAGIDNIVDFRAEANNQFKMDCEKKGFKYLNFPLDSLWHRDKSPYFNTNRDGKKIATDILVDKLKLFINILKNGNTYMGCHYGIDRTNLGVILHYLFIKNDKVCTPQILNWAEQSKKSVINKDFKIIKRVLKSLTSEQKQVLNLPENINEEALKKFKLILSHNAMKV